MTTIQKAGRALAAGLALLTATLTATPFAWAATTPDKAATLKTTLTPFGAERAGNADGSIPAWTGGLTQTPAGYKPGDARAEPYPGEKPLYTITAKNMDQYADKLTDGVKAMLSQYPSFELQVYPTHRSAAAPQWVYDHTYANATRAKTADKGLSVTGAYGGIPFPIPNDGFEAMWNHRLAWQGETVDFQFRGFVVTADGKRSLASHGSEQIQTPYYFQDGSLEKFSGDTFTSLLTFNGPPTMAGQGLLTRDRVDLGTTPTPSWQYLVGQRRVRRSPAVNFDTPNFIVSGIGFFDEAFMFLGSMERFDWKLIGKKEIYIPYNNNGAAKATIDELMGPKHLNPNKVRWELHRVWEIEATLAPGKRHVVPKRKYYLDEDTWLVVLEDGWDAEGKLWRTGWDLMLTCPDIPAVVGTMMWGLNDLRTGSYYYNLAPNELPMQYRTIPRLPETYFSPEAMAARNLR